MESGIGWIKIQVDQTETLHVEGLAREAGLTVPQLIRALLGLRADDLPAPLGEPVVAQSKPELKIPPRPPPKVKIRVRNCPPYYAAKRKKRKAKAKPRPKRKTNPERERWVPPPDIPNIIDRLTVEFGRWKGMWISAGQVTEDGHFEVKERGGEWRRANPSEIVFDSDTPLK